MNPYIFTYHHTNRFNAVKHINLFVAFLSVKFKCTTFAPTVHTTLPIRTASQGVSFAFITFYNAVALPLHNAPMQPFFYDSTRFAYRKICWRFFFVPLAQ